MALDIFDKDRLTRLALKMKKGDRRAAGELYEELFPKVYGFLITRTGNKDVAEDLAQDIFVKLVERVESYDEKRGRFTVWFWQMTRNALIDYYREKKETPFSEFSEEALPLLAIAEAVDIESRLAHQELIAFAATLADDEREIFELRYVAEMPYKEIAVLLAKSEGALRVSALRIKQKIKRQIGKRHKK